MDAVQDLPEQDSAEMRQAIDETRSALADKLEALESRVVHSVQSAQETVQESLQSAKDTVASVTRTFDIKHQVEQRPWTMVGGVFSCRPGCGPSATHGKGTLCQDCGWSRRKSPCRSCHAEFTA